MKQTNNAIKFLMAQYRAIFRNANLKMFLAAATAAAAMAAGSAQAAAPFTNTELDALSGGETIELNGTGDGAGGVYSSMTLSGATTPGTPITKQFTLKITDGSGNKIDGAAADTDVLSAEKASLIIEGSKTAKDTSLTIGESHGAVVTFKDVKVSKGTLNLTNGSLTAKTSVVIGAEAAAPQDPATVADAADSLVVIDAKGSLIANEAGSSITINKGGEINFADKAVATTSKVESKSIKVNGGTISVTESGNGTVVGDVKVVGGAITINGDTDTSSLVVKGNVSYSGDGGSLTIAKAGTLKVTSDAGSATLDLGNATVSNAGTVDFGKIAAGQTASLVVSADQYDNLFKGLVQVEGADANTHNVLDVAVKGKTEIDLDTILDAGALDAAKIKLTTGKLKSFSADNAKYALGEIKTGGALTFGTLNAGATNALKLSGSTDVTITNVLGVNGGSEKGVLTLDAAKLTLSGAGAEHTVKASEIKVAATGGVDTTTLTVTGGGTWSVGSLNLTKGSVTVDGGSTLVVNGDLTTPAADSGSIVVQNASTLDASAVTKLTVVSGTATKPTIDVKSGSTLELNQKDVFTIDGDAIKLADGKGTDGHKIEALSIKTSADSVLQFNVDKDFKLNEKQLTSLIETLGGKAEKQLAGFISFGDNFKLEGITDEPVDISKVTGADVYGGVTATTADGVVDHNVMVGNIKVTSDTGTVEVKANTTAVLYKADSNNNLVSNNKGTANVTLGDKAQITLAGTGNAGTIDGLAANQGNVVFGHSKTKDTEHTVTVESIGAKNGVASVSVAHGNVVLTAKPGEDAVPVALKTGSLSLDKGTSLSADGHVVTVSGAADTNLLGDFKAKSLTFTQAAANTIIANDALVDLDELTLAASATGKISVGVDTEQGSSGTLEVGKLTLNGGSLIVDPIIGKPAAIAAVKTLSATAKDGEGTDAQVLDGNIIVGMNSAVGIGYDTRAEVEQLMINSGYIDPTNHSFKSGTDVVQSALVLNTPIVISDGKYVTVDANYTTPATPATVDTLTVAANSAMVINDSVYTIGADGKKTGVAVTFVDGRGTAKAGNVDASAGKIILAGDFDGSDDGIKIFNKEVTSADNITVVSANGILSGTITNGAIVDLQADPTKLAEAFSTVSAPVRDLLKDRIVNDANRFDKSQLGAKFLGQVANDITDSSGVKADAAAHAATYAGAQVAAVASVTTMAEAVGGRVGSMGVEATAITATGSQANGGVWVAPMYKSVDADGFNAEGASYGADVDLAGVAFGADTVNGNMRFGAVFNIGSGDADGKGNGSGLKDEFDYYGFGIYSVMGFGNFALVGDASLNIISHEVEGFELNGSADTTAVTMGVTGQYTISNPMVDVTPHLGARFIRLDTDSYDLKSAEGTLATTDFEVQNVFSVPLGVTLSKAFEMGGWSLAPSADLSITFNTGDTDAKSTTQFTGAYGIDLTSEVLDEVTYGVAVGLGAQYGAFGTNIGLNYTGSENTDSFGVNAQARYMF